MRGQRTLERGRKLAEARMDAKCVVTREGEKIWDENLGDYWTEDICAYRGKCRVAVGATSGKKADAGSQLVVVTSPEIHIPVGKGPLKVGDMVRIRSCVSNPDLKGRVYIVREPFDGGQVTALRYRVEVDDGR